MNMHTYDIRILSTGDHKLISRKRRQTSIIFSYPPIIIFYSTIQVCRIDFFEYEMISEIQINYK